MKKQRNHWDSKKVVISEEEYKIGDCVYLDPTDPLFAPHLDITKHTENTKPTKAKNFPPLSDKQLRKKLTEIKTGREKAYERPTEEEGWRKRHPDAIRKFDSNTKKMYDMHPYVIGRITEVSKPTIQVQLFYRYGLGTICLS